MRFPITTRLAFLVLSLCVYSSSDAQRETWNVYTSKRTVRDIAVMGGAVWAATSGGLFSYTLSDTTFQEFTTSNGLRTIDLTAIAVDKQGTIWLGASDGWLQAYHPLRKQWEYFSDIVSLSTPSKRINALQVMGDTLFILSDVGVSLYSLSRREFGDTYMQFGSASKRLVGKTTSVQYYQQEIWVATLNGIVATDISNPNPSAPESWQVYTDTSHGLPFTSLTPIQSLAVADSHLFAATPLGIYFLSGKRWQIVQGTNGMSVKELWKYSPSSLTFIFSNELWLLTSIGETYSLQQIASGFPSGLTSAVGDSVVGTQSGGVFTRSTSGWKQVVPPGPISNSFVGLAVDNNGVLWTGTGDATNLGFQRFDGRRWKVYSPNTDTILGPYGGTAYQVDIGPNNTKWISLFGPGVAMVNANDEVERVFNTTNGLPYTANTANNRSFVVVTGVVADARGDVWINIRNAADHRLLAVYSPSADTFRYVTYPGATNPVLMNITTDHYGTKWFTSINEVGVSASPGLVFYDETRRLPKRLNDTTGWGVITKENGLTSNQVSAVAVDRDGALWVGSPTPAFGDGNDGGISIILDPVNAPDRILIYHPLQDQKINDILVDPLNRKWVATDRGIFLLSPDGTSILERYTVVSTNGILPDDKVISLAINHNTGVLYAGTEKGLATLSTPAVMPVRSFGDLHLYPNPYYLPSNNQLTIDGLMQGSTLKILTANGDLVKEIKTPGGRVGYWDGKNEKGEWVASAVYLVVAFSEDGKQVATGKIAVLRK